MQLKLMTCVINSVFLFLKTNKTISVTRIIIISKTVTSYRIIISRY